MPLELIDLETGTTCTGTQPAPGQAIFDPVRHKWCSATKRVLPRSTAEQIDVLVSRIIALEQQVADLRNP